MMTLTCDARSVSEQQLSAVEQAYRLRVESELVRELEEESRRMREEMRKTLVTHEERCAPGCCV